MVTSYEPYAEELIKHRSQRIGLAELMTWSQQLPQHSKILDLGCGHGLPLASALQQEGHQLFGVDVAPTLIAHYQRNVPNSQTEVNSVPDSSFFSENFPDKFDAVIAIGLLFLMVKDEQAMLFPKVSAALTANGRFLFNSPWQICDWEDILSGDTSYSLGRDRYCELLLENGMEVKAEFVDEGENHYYDALKCSSE